MEQRVKYVGDILQALLVARKRKWDENEVVRMERESEVFKYVKALVEKERKELLEDAGQDEEKIDDVNYIQVQHSRVFFSTVITIPVANKWWSGWADMQNTTGFWTIQGKCDGKQALTGPILRVAQLNI